MKARRLVLSGCSGGGKSTLLDEMSRRGYATVSEPGRRVIEQARDSTEDAVPWKNPRTFCLRVIETAVSDFYRTNDDLVIFDRSALDALIWFDRTAEALSATTRQMILNLGYDQKVYLFPPWPEIFTQDDDRRHGIGEALAEYQALCDRLPHYGYRTVIVPKTAVDARADWLEEQLR